MADVLEQCLAHVQRPDAHRLPSGLNGKREEPKPNYQRRAAIAVSTALLISLLVWSVVMRLGGRENVEDAGRLFRGTNNPTQPMTSALERSSDDQTLSEATAVSASLEGELRAIDRSLNHLEQSFFSDGVE